MREFGLILENLDGFDDLENKFVMRGIPHLLALRTSVNSPQGSRTGWSGDGARGWITPILCHRRRDSTLYQDPESGSASIFGYRPTRNWMPWRPSSSPWGDNKILRCPCR
jgi:hypothetical protein